MPPTGPYTTPPELRVGPPSSSVPTSPPLVGDEPVVVALVERARKRDQAAFAGLYDQFLGPVYRYIFYRVGNRADAEDLSEQVFLQAWAAIERFRWQSKPFLAWLYALAHNLVIDWRRRAKPALSLNDDDYPIDPENPSAAQAMTQWLDADLLAAAIARLTVEQQQVIILKFIEGFDTAQVARVLAKRAGTIRALQLRALQSLRRELERQGEQGSI